MIKSYLYIVFLIWVNLVFSQNFTKSDTLKKSEQLLDTYLLSDKLNWSFRVASNFKEQRFRLSNDNESLKYIPNNPYGIGFGVANQKLIIDIIFNLKTNKKEPTTKFAAEGATIFKKNLFTFTIENVHGYNVSDNKNNVDLFRNDLSIFSLGIDYNYFLSKKPFTVRGLKSGLTTQDKTSVTFGVGGFLILNSLNSDGSIIPIEDVFYFNNEAQIYKMSAYGAGISAGFSTYFVLPAHFFASIFISPGIGIEHKYVKAETVNYYPTNPLLYKTALFASAGYNHKKFYINFTFGTNAYFTNLDFENKGLLSVTKSKLIFGYNLGKVKVPKKIF